MAVITNAGGKKGRAGAVWALALALVLAACGNALQDELDSLKKELADKNAQIETLQNEKTTAESSVAELTAQRDALGGLEASLREQLEEAGISGTTLQNQIDVLIHAKTDLAADLAEANDAIAFKDRQISVITAGGRLHEQDWFDRHDLHITALKAEKTAGHTVDALLIGDDEFDRFDAHDASTYYNNEDQYDKLLGVPVSIPTTFNLGIEGDTVGDVAWRVNEILGLRTGDNLPDIRYVVLNVGGNDLKAADSTQTDSIGSTEYIAKRIRDIASTVKSELSTTTKVGVLTPVYRGDLLNLADQESLRYDIVHGIYTTPAS